jgi:hypothetical protein
VEPLPPPLTLSLACNPPSPLSSFFPPPSLLSSIRPQVREVCCVLGTQMDSEPSPYFHVPRLKFPPWSRNSNLFSLVMLLIPWRPPSDASRLFPGGIFAWAPLHDSA